MSDFRCICPRIGMVGTRDLKSLGLIGRAGSSSAVGAKSLFEVPLKPVKLGLHPQKRSSPRGSTVVIFGCSGMQDGDSELMSSG